MITKKLSLLSSILIALSAVLLIISVKFPWWGMNFIAPQYPEGLDIIVYPNKMAGQVDIINNLNHYIGMQEFSEKSFPELQYLTYIIYGVAGLAFLVALIRKKFLLYLLLAIFIIGGIVGIYDIHRWLSDFGTNLDPKAPIDIPPFTPPILGENHLANFVTYSKFLTGSYLLGLSFLMLVLPLWLERKKVQSK
jgi:copper chaperone NosL